MEEKTRTVSTDEELAKAVKDDVDTIEIEGPLGKKTIRIKATGKIAWAVCFAALAIAVASILTAPTTSGTSTVAGVVVAPAVVSILGMPTTLTAISIAVAGGGIGILNKLRKYDMEKRGNLLILKKK